MKRYLLSVAALFMTAMMLSSCASVVDTTFAPATPTPSDAPSSSTIQPTPSASLLPSPTETQNVSDASSETVSETASPSESITPQPTSSAVVTPTPAPTPTPTPTPTLTPSASEEFDPLAFYDYQFVFQTDLSAYEDYMNPKGEDYLFLVNAENVLEKGYKPDDLVGAVNTRDDRDTLKLRAIADKALQALYIEAEAAGILYKNKVWQSNGIYYDYYTLGITSGYRSYAEQEYLYESRVEAKMATGMTREEAEAAVTTTAKPGTSEHQTGLCADMHNFRTASSTDGMREEFAASKAGQWLLENCHKFGFILRYPEDKTEITGIGYESWHFRYVGRFHATRMKELGFCLEEYIEYLEGYGYQNVLPSN